MNINQNPCYDSHFQHWFAEHISVSQYKYRTFFRSTQGHLKAIVTYKY